MYAIFPKSSYLFISSNRLIWKYSRENWNTKLMSGENKAKRTKIEGDLMKQSSCPDMVPLSIANNEK